MATSKSQSLSSIEVDTSGLKELAKVLRQAQPELKKELYKGLRLGAAVVLEEAKYLSDFSSRIPGSLKIGGSGLNLKIVGQGAIAADDAPLENQGNTGSFRHPVFGNQNVWVEQPAHPFLAPAVDARIDQVVELVDDAVNAALIAAGFDD